MVFVLPCLGPLGVKGNQTILSLRPCRPRSGGKSPVPNKEDRLLVLALPPGQIPHLALALATAPSPKEALLSSTPLPGHFHHLPMAHSLETRCWLTNCREVLSVTKHNSTNQEKPPPPTQPSTITMPPKILGEAFSGIGHLSFLESYS